jgi:hypothetical protein
MSFNDVGKGGGARRPSAVTSGGAGSGGGGGSGGTVFRSLDPLDQISDSIINLQKSCNQLKEKHTELRRRKVNSADKFEIDDILKKIKADESRLKIQIDNESKKLENMPRTEAAQKRVTLSKLQKDYDKLKLSVQALSSESSVIKVNDTDGFGTKSSNKAQSGDEYSSNSSSSNSSSGGGGGGNRGTALAEPQLIEIQSQDIDEMILEERNREIKKINQDILMVNEIFKDMAEIVSKQGEQIDNVKKVTDDSHANAKQGLEQVNQAAKHQPGCILS